MSKTLVTFGGHVHVPSAVKTSARICLSDVSVETALFIEARIATSAAARFAVRSARPSKPTATSAALMRPSPSLGMVMAAG
jgi:hypothetical protein